MNLFEQLKEFLKKENVYFIERFGQHPSVNIKVSGDCGLLFVTIYFIEEKNTLLCKTDFPHRIPSTKRYKIFEYISVVNSESLISTFILDHNNFLFVKTSLFSCESLIEAETFRRFVFVNINSVNYHYKKIMILSGVSELGNLHNKIPLN
jgi:hypothetical protein